MRGRVLPFKSGQDSKQTVLLLLSFVGTSSFYLTLTPENAIWIPLEGMFSLTGRGAIHPFGVNSRLRTLFPSLKSYPERVRLGNTLSP